MKSEATVIPINDILIPARLFTSIGYGIPYLFAKFVDERPGPDRGHRMTIQSPNFSLNAPELDTDHRLIRNSAAFRSLCVDMGHLFRESGFDAGTDATTHCTVERWSERILRTCNTFTRNTRYRNLLMLDRTEAMDIFPFMDKFCTLTAKYAGSTDGSKLPINSGFCSTGMKLHKADIEDAIKGGKMYSDFEIILYGGARNHRQQRRKFGSFFYGAKYRERKSTEAKNSTV